MMTMTIQEPAIEDPQADLRRVWGWGYNCGEGRLHEIDPDNTAALHYEQQRRERRMRMYANLVIRDLDADPDRLIRVAALARELVRQAGAEHDLSARERLLERVNDDDHDHDPPAWIEQWHHDITPVARLPLPRELERPPCMIGRRLRTLHRIVRQLAPRAVLRECCSYHGQDWGYASETAIRLLGIAQGEGLEGEEASDRVTELARAEQLSKGDIKAIRCLVSTSAPLMLHDDERFIYADGRHRIQAMIDQGVKRTILLRLVLLDRATGQPF